MPCNTITTQSIKLANAMPEIILSAMANLSGWTLHETSDKNKVTISGIRGTAIWIKGKGLEIKSMSNAQNIIAEISQAYSKQAVTWAAQRAGWQVTNVNQNTLNIVRR